MTLPATGGKPLARTPAGVRQAAVAAGLAKRLRATIAAAAAPNSRIIGGAGTGAGGPPDEPVLPEPELPLLLHPWLLEP